MSLLQVNNNVLREAKYNLKIINGEYADVYINNGDPDPNNWTPNFSLNEAGYWKDFLNTTNHLSLPIINISSLIKSQSIWYRNTSFKDTLVIEVASDEQNNIVEFINKNVGSFELLFDNIEQLIFIAEVTFINSVGWQTTRPFFVGRPSIQTNTDDRLIFRVDALDSILIDADFASSVLEANSGSFYNFISLKEAYERIINNPHNKNDDYVYPVCPFEIDGETYIKDPEQNYKYRPYLQSTDEVYAEDYITGNTDKAQVFYYRNSPECGIITIDKNNPELYEIDNLSSWRFFTNDVVQFGTPENNYKAHTNCFRMFRPFKSFIAPETIDTMRTGFAYLDDDYLGIIISDSNNPEFQIDAGDEIVICEQLMDFGIKGLTVSRIILFTGLSNVFYYNKTKNIFYWNPIVTGANTTPLPKQWLDMISYLDIDNTLIRYDINYNEGQDISSEIDNLDSAKYYWSTYSQNQFPLWSNAEFSFIRRSNDTPSNSSGFPILSCAVSQTLLPCYNKDRSVEYYVETNLTEMKVNLDLIHEWAKPKSIRLDLNYNIIWSYDTYYQIYFAFPDPISFTYPRVPITLKKKAWNNTVTTLTNADETKVGYFLDNEDPPIPEPGISHDFAFFYTYEISETFNENTMVLGFARSEYNEIDNYQILPFADEGYVKKRLTNIEYIINNTEVNYINGYTYIYQNDISFVLPNPSQTTIFKIDTSQTNPYEELYFYEDQYFILDINMTLNRMIVRDLTDRNKIKYLELPTLDEIYIDTIELPNIDFLFSSWRTDVFFIDTSNDSYLLYINADTNEPVRLLGFNGTRFNSHIGLANSFLKNVYNNNYGIKYIGYTPQTKIVINDSIIQKSTFSVDTIQFNKLEWSKYSRKKQEFTGIDNDEANNKTVDDNNYDEAISVNMYSNIDIDMNITLYRTASNMEYTVSNEFAQNVTGSFTPPNYQTFEFALTGDFAGIEIFVNFFDTELEVGKYFRGRIEKRTLSESGIKDSVTSLDKTFIWRDKKVFGFKFPFLYEKYASEFSDEIEKYWIDDRLNIRKIITAELTIPDLILFNENYSIFNIGDAIITIDSKAKYLDGYYLSTSGIPIKYNNNKCDFYIEKIYYNFRDKTTKFILVSV